MLFDRNLGMSHDKMAPDQYRCDLGTNQWVKHALFGAINSVVVVGLYYGFLTTFSIGPSYLFLLQAQVMEEGTEKKVSATTDFITG